MAACRLDHFGCIAHALCLRAGCTFASAGNQKRAWLDCFGCHLMDPWRHKVSQIYTGVPPYAPSAALGMYAAMLAEWLEWFPAQQMQVRACTVCKSATSNFGSKCRCGDATAPHRGRTTHTRNLRDIPLLSRPRDLGQRRDAACSCLCSCTTWGEAGRG